MPIFYSQKQQKNNKKSRKNQKNIKKVVDFENFGSFWESLGMFGNVWETQSHKSLPVTQTNCSQQTAARRHQPPRKTIARACGEAARLPNSLKISQILPYSPTKKPPSIIQPAYAENITYREWLRCRTILRQI